MLSERQLEVVLAVVYEYIQGGDPIGSRVLSKRHLTGRSAATIRNEMAELADMGFLEQPHASAGRVPTARAYRLYVDSILQRHRELPPEAEGWISEVRDQRRGVEDVLSHISHLLSRVTSYMGVATLAPLEKVGLLRLDFVRLDNSRALAVVVLEGGLVHHRVLGLPCEMNQEELDILASRIQAVAVGRPWKDVRRDLLQYVVAELRDREASCRVALGELERLLASQTTRVFMGGARHLLNLPDFHDIGRLQAVFSLLEEECAMAQLVGQCAQDQGVSVTIGDENPLEALRECSLVLAPVSAAGQKAVVGLIGPVRMNYEGAIAVVEAVLTGLQDTTEKPLAAQEVS